MFDRMPALRPVIYSDRHWFVDDDFTWSGGYNQTVTIPKGFVTDLASVPRFLWVIFPPFGKYTAAAVLHDFLYKEGDISRFQADGIFRIAMAELQVPFWKRWLMWSAVRLFGFMNFPDTSSGSGPQLS